MSLASIIFWVVVARLVFWLLEIFFTL